MPSVLHDVVQLVRAALGAGHSVPFLKCFTAGQGRVRETTVGYDLIQYNAKCPHVRLNGEMIMLKCFRSYPFEKEFVLPKEFIDSIVINSRNIEDRYLAHQVLSN